MDKIEDNVAIRLKFLIQKLGITNSIFAENCDISRATLSQLLTGRNQKISNVIINKIHEAYPQVSILWLLFNEGDMFSNANSENDDCDTNSNSSFNTHDGDGYPSNSDSYKQEGNSYLSNGFENPNSLTVPQGDQKKSKENRLNPYPNSNQFSDNLPLNPSENIPALLKEIENLKKKPRKVVQITIYYDDSTFETFVPGSK